MSHIQMVEIRRELFRALMNDLFGRLQSPKKRFLAKRQTRILTALLADDVLEQGLSAGELMRRMAPDYKGLASSQKAMVRDIIALFHLRALRLWDVKGETQVAIDLDWPSKMTESVFFETIKNMPKAKYTLSI